MIAEISGRQLIGAGLASSVVLGGVSGETVQTVGIIAAFVCAVLSGFVWQEARTKALIKAHADEEARLDEVRQTSLLNEIRAMLAEHRALAAEHRADELGRAS